MSEIERTSPNSARATVVYDRTPSELLEVTTRAIDSLPRWILSERDKSGFRAMRATKLLRFKDDVSVRASPESEGRTRLELASASRRGKSDLGQNPRNLRELLDVIDEIINAEPG